MLERVVAPVTPRVLDRVAAPVTPRVELAESVVKEPVVAFTAAKVEVPVTPRVELRVVAPVTPNVPGTLNDVDHCGIVPEDVRIELAAPIETLFVAENAVETEVALAFAAIDNVSAVPTIETTLADPVIFGLPEINIPGRIPVALVTVAEVLPEVVVTVVLTEY